jgi:integrase
MHAKDHHEEVFAFLEVIRPDFHDYFVVRFFTGLRSSEIDALRWQNVDIEKKRIFVREALVKGHLERTKTDGSTGSVQFNQLVCDALNRQWIISGHRGQGDWCSATPKGKHLMDLMWSNEFGIRPCAI